MATDQDRLIVSFEARLTQFERAMAKVNGTADRTYNRVSSGSAKAARDMDRNFAKSANAIRNSLADLGSSFKGGLFGGFTGGAVGATAAATLVNIPRQIQQVTGALAEMKAEAARAGLPVEDFQALAYAARQSKVPVDALTDGMKELQLRADEFVTTGTGSAAEAFGRLGYTASELKAKLKDPVALFGEIIDRLKAMDKAAQIRITDEVFGGTGGERFLALLSSSSRSLGDLMDEAYKVGAVLDSETVDKAAELDAKFNAVAESIEGRLKTAVVGLGSFIDEAVTKVGALEQEMAKVGNLPFWTKLSEWTGATAEDRARAQLQFGLQRSGLGDRPDLTGWSGVRGGSAPTEITITGRPDPAAGLTPGLQAKVRQFIADAAAQGLTIGISSGLRSTEQQAAIWAKTLAEFNGNVAEARKHAAPPGSSMHETGRAADITFGSQAAREWAAANAGFYGLAFPVATETPLGGPANGHTHAHVEEAGSRSGTTRDASAEAAKRQKAAIDDLFASYDRETEMMRAEGEAAKLSMAERVKMLEVLKLENDLRAAGIVNLDPYRQKIEEEATARANLVTMMERQGQAAASVREAYGFFSETAASGLADVVTGAATAEDAIRRLVSALTDAALQAILLGQGPLAGLFGTATGGGLFGIIGKAMSIPAAAGGGRVVGPGTGTSDSIPARLSHGEFVVNAAATRKNLRVLEAINAGKMAGLAGVGLVLPALSRLPTAVASGGGGGASVVTFNQRLTIDLTGANGDAAIARAARWAAEKGAADGARLALKASPARLARYQKNR